MGGASRARGWVRVVCAWCCVLAVLLGLGTCVASAAPVGGGAAAGCGGCCAHRPMVDAAARACCEVSPANGETVPVFAFVGANAGAGEWVRVSAVWAEPGAGSSVVVDAAVSPPLRVVVLRI